VAAPVPSAAGRPLVVADDPDLLDDLVRLAAAACVEVDVAPDPTAARLSWASATTVFVDAGLAESCVRARLPRRPRVVLVAGSGAAADDDAVWSLAAQLGSEHVVFLPAAEAWLVDRFSEATAGRGSPGRLVGVLAGRGGGGASVLAAALAVTAVRAGIRTLLVDADPYGGGLDLVLGGEDTAGLRWPDLAGMTGRVSGPALYEALPSVGELCVLSWDRGDLLSVSPAAVDAVLDAGRQSGELVVVDLPRRPDDAAVRVLQAADLVLLVVPAEVRACAAAARVAHAVVPHCRDLRVVIRGPAPAGLRSRDLARVLGLPIAGIMRPERGLAAGLERGEVPGGRGTGPLAELCRKLLASLDLGPGGSAVA
jgi:secretion/DNA translocation related CpaE-like protein